MRKHSYNYRPKTKLTLKKKISHFFRTLFEVCLSLLVLAVIVLMGGLAVNKLQVKLALADTLQYQIDTLKKEKDVVEMEKETYKQKLEDASKITVDDKTKEIVEYYICKYFGNRCEDAKKVFTCESHLNPQAKNVNTKATGKYKDSVDRGIAQLNDVAQRANFERLNPGISFEVGAHDIQMNIATAKAIYDGRGGNFSAWVCARIVGIN